MPRTTAHRVPFTSPTASTGSGGESDGDWYEEVQAACIDCAAPPSRWSRRRWTLSQLPVTPGSGGCTHGGRSAVARVSSLRVLARNAASSRISYSGRVSTPSAIA
jgi:hypothetical protein